MEYIFFSNIAITNSLTRYFKFMHINKDYSIPDNKYLFWEEMKSIDNEVLLKAGNFKKYIIIPLVYKRNKNRQCINLLNLKRLKEDIIYALRNYSQYNLLYIKKVRDKLKNFFKGHGHEAIFSVLIKTLSGFKNGLNPFLQKEYNQKDLDNKFLKPGLKNWKLFIERFKKYEDFLYVCGFRDEVNKINKLIFVTKPNMKYIDQNRIEKSIAERENIVNSLEKIDKLLMNMKKKVEEYK